MNIDVECIALLCLILQDTPRDRQYILCVLARSNSLPSRIVFHSNTDYPTFYGYFNNKIPHYLMGQGVISNVPREGFAKRVISAQHLSQLETLINNDKKWDAHEKLISVSKFITLDNKTAYKDAEVFLVFRDKTLAYIKECATSHKLEISNFLGPELSKDIFGESTKESVNIKAKLSRKSLEKIWEVLQEIENKRGITPEGEDISIPQVHMGKTRDENGAKNYSNERLNILKKLEQEGAVTDIRWQKAHHLNGYLKIGNRYFEVLDFYENEYKNAAKSYQESQEQTAGIGNNKGVAYRITYSPKNREILVNEFLLAKPDFNSENEITFSYLYDNSNKTISINEIEKQVGQKLKKSIHEILRDLGFTGSFAKAFFSASNKGVIFRNPITFQDLKDLKIDFIKIQEKK